jgi:hypothetical protein
MDSKADGVWGAYRILLIVFLAQAFAGIFKYIFLTP